MLLSGNGITDVDRVETRIGPRTLDHWVNDVHIILEWFQCGEFVYKLALYELPKLLAECEDLAYGSYAINQNFEGRTRKTEADVFRDICKTLGRG